MENLTNVISISSSSDKSGNTTVVALCEDRSVWVKVGSTFVPVERLSQWTCINKGQNKN